MVLALGRTVRLPSWLALTSQLHPDLVCARLDWSTPLLARPSPHDQRQKRFARDVRVLPDGPGGKSLRYHELRLVFNQASSPVKIVHIAPRQLRGGNEATYGAARSRGLEANANLGTGAALPGNLQIGVTSTRGREETIEFVISSQTTSIGEGTNTARITSHAPDAERGLDHHVGLAFVVECAPSEPVSIAFSTKIEPNGDVRALFPQVADSAQAKIVGVHELTLAHDYKRVSDKILDVFSLDEGVRRVHGDPV